jgi:hypothetical protein
VWVVRKPSGYPPAAIAQDVPFTDLPLDRIDIWADFNGEFWTLYLLSEC